MRRLRNERYESDVKLVLVRTETAAGVSGHALKDEVPSGPSRRVNEVHNLSSKVVPPVAFLEDFLRCEKRCETSTFCQTCTLKTNYFVANLLKNQVYKYDVCISPEDGPLGVNRAVIAELVSQHRQSDLGGCFPAYDGRKGLYTSGPLPFISWRTFEIELKDEEDSIGQTPRSQKGARLFTVVIKYAACIALQPGGQEYEKQAALRALDIILRETFIGRCYSLPESSQLGEGLEIRIFYKTLQLTKKGLLLNIDISPIVPIRPIPVIDYIAQLLDRVILDRPLSDDDHTKIKKALEGVIVKVTCESIVCKKYRVFGLTVKATREIHVQDNGTNLTHYFQETYGYKIKNTCLPCLEVGNEKRPIYLPMEVCIITEGQQLSQKQKSPPLEVSRLNPTCREHLILEALNHYNEDPHLKEFGIKIETQLLSVNARVLPPPWLKFHGTGKTKEFLPEIGIWSMVRKRMLNGAKVSNWTCLNFCWDVTEKIISGFCHELAIMCQASGMVDFPIDPVLPVLSAAPEDVELALKSCLHDVTQEGRKLDLLIVILPDNNGVLYGNLKRICETDIGLVSQCCLAKHVSNTKKRYLANVALKINVKVGGTNAALLDALNKRLPCVGDKPTIIFGAHVMHPGKNSGPSIAAVVASQDWPGVTNYAALASAQSHHQEFIEHLHHKTGDIARGMIIEHLVSFKIANGRKPQRIIFYRDAVSNGLLYQVMWQELVAIKKACSNLDPDYNPSVTYVVIEKHRHTRFFTDDEHNKKYFSGNVLPGTVVDSDICHESCFYLCSHVGTQGMTRPVHYHVLWDENRFTADKFQCLTNYLCYTDGRCTQSVSIVPPVCYARLMASRGRLYMEPATSGSARVEGASAAPSTSDGSVTVRCLPAVKDNVKRGMFYC